jgi:predicted permease
MRWLTRLRLRLRSLFRSAQVERELDEELGYHRERAIEEGVAAGLGAREARLAAERILGPTARSMEECRDARGLGLVEHRIQDLRFALRQLRRHPAFAATAVLTLALGLGASVALFGFVDAALLKPLPYADPSRLVTAFGAREPGGRSQTRSNVSYQDFRDWRARNRAFAALGAYDVRTGFTLSTPEGPERVPGLSVTAGFFETLGVTPALGRTFRADEEGPDAPAAVMLAYGAWQSRFGGNPDVLGTTLPLQGEPHVVIGVLPRDFHFTLAADVDFWTAIRGQQYCWGARACSSLEAIGRLGPGVSRLAAAEGLAATLRQLRAEHPDVHKDPEVARLTPLADVMFGEVRPVLLALASGAALLFVVACINVVSLLLARSEGRGREIGVRHALGASSARLVQQFATEALVLTALGGLLGLALAAGGMWFLQGLLSADMLSRMPYLKGIGLSLRSGAFAVLLALVAAAAFTLTPMLRVKPRERLARLQANARGSSGTAWRSLGSRLVTAELAIAVVLLVSAGLLARSLERLLHVDIGLNARRLALLGVQPDPSDTQQPPGLLAQQVAARVAALPQVESVSYSDRAPLALGLAPTSVIHREGADDRGLETHPVRRIGAGYFATLQARLRRGREFSVEEVAGVRRVVVLNETAAQRYLPGDDPIGKAIVVGALPAREVVGVVADIKDGSLETPATPAAYVPFDQSGFGLVVRTAGDAGDAFPTLAAAIREVRPGLLVHGQTTMESRLDQLPSARRQRSSAGLAAAFAAIAFVLGVVGLYGVVAYSVGQRTREIGVRMALGARRGAVYRLVLGEAAWLVGSGTIAGLVCAVAAATLMRGLLFGVAAWDAPTLATAAAVLAAAAFLASYVPARRAASVNPIEVLRAD